MHHLGESQIFLFLLQVFILMGCARGLGEVFKRFKQPAVTAEILVGLLLGPTIMGRFLPELQQSLFPPEAIQQAMLDTLAWIGVLFLLLDTGLELDFSIAWRQRSSALVIALFDVIVPMVVAFAVVVWLPDRYLVNPDQRVIFSLFMATVMTISALPVAARVLHDFKILKADLGFLVMSALAVNDIIGWVLFTIILGTFTSGTVALGPIAFVFVATIGFAAFALTIGRRLSTRLFDSVKRRNFPEPGTSLTIVVLLGLLFGAFTQKLGIHALFGFFIAGIVVGEARSLSEQTRSVISQMVHSLFVPLFFANIGLKLDFFANFDIFLVTLISVIGIGGRYLGAWLGVTLTTVPRINRDLISIAHTPGGMMEVVIALLAFQSGLITAEVFVAIIFGAIFSSIIMGPWMARSMARRTATSAAQFLLPDAIVAELKATTRADAINTLAERAAPRLDEVQQRQITDGAMARERDFGTAIGDGIAIPHVRIEGLKNPVLAYGRSAEGIDWDAPDGGLVHHVFFLATPVATADLHVQILASIARALEEPANRQDIINAPNAAALYRTLSVLLAMKKPARPPGKADHIDKT